jgi:hypothetical protein
MTEIATVPATTRTWAYGTGVAAAAAAAAEAVYFALRNGAGIDLAVRSGNTVDHVGPVAVAATSVVAVLAGWGLLALLERVTGRGRLIWSIIAAAVLVVSMLGVTGGVGASAKLGLAALHLTVAAVLIVGLLWVSGKARR